MKNRMILIVLLLSIIMTGCTVSYRNVNNNDNNDNDKETEVTMSTDIKAIAKLFPELTGVESAEWEQITLGDGQTDLPGPTDYRYQGYIILNDAAADSYLQTYSWDPETPEVSFRKIEPKDGDWKYSEDFAEDVIPGYYPGKIWMDGNVLLFSVTTT